MVGAVMAYPTPRKTGSLPPNAALDISTQEEFNQKVKKLKSKKGNEDTEKGVVYIGHIPRGFEEKQMEGYFNQFGRVTRLHVSRSKKTGNIKGYAFVEFESSVVAKIVADSMNNYLMFNRLLKCQFVPPEKVHASTFKGCRRTFSKPKAHLLAIERHNQLKTSERLRKNRHRQQKRKAKSVARLAEMGIEYNLPDKLVTRAACRQPSDTTRILPELCEEAKEVKLIDHSSDEKVGIRTSPKAVRALRSKVVIKKDGNVKIKANVQQPRCKGVLKKQGGVKKQTGIKPAKKQVKRLKK